MVFLFTYTVFDIWRLACFTSSLWIFDVDNYLTWVFLAKLSSTKIDSRFNLRWADFLLECGGDSKSKFFFDWVFYTEFFFEDWWGDSFDVWISFSDTLVNYFFGKFFGTSGSISFICDSISAFCCVNWSMESSIKLFVICSTLIFSYGRSDVCIICSHAYDLLDCLSCLSSLTSTSLTSFSLEFSLRPYMLMTFIFILYCFFFYFSMKLISSASEWFPLSKDYMSTELTSSKFWPTLAALSAMRSRLATISGQLWLNLFTCYWSKCLKTIF